MRIAEVAIQGLDGAVDYRRSKVSPGLALIQAGSREALFGRTVVDLLYPPEGDSALRSLVIPGAQARAGVTAAARDGVTYRLLCEINTGRRVFQRVVNEQAQVLFSTPPDVASAARSVFSLPSEGVFRDVFFFTPDELPSAVLRRAARQAREHERQTRDGERSQPSTRSPAPAVFDDPELRTLVRPASPPGFRSDSGPGISSEERVAQLRDRLNVLESIRAQLHEVRELAFEADGVQQEIFALETQLEPLQAAHSALKEAVEKVRAFDDVAAIPPEVIALADNLPAAAAEHKKELARYAFERVRIYESAGPIAPDGAKRDPLRMMGRERNVKLGLAIGCGAIVSAVVGSLAVSPALQWLALLDIPALAVALVGSIRVLGDLEQVGMVERRLARLDAEEHAVMKRFAAHEKHVHDSLKQYNLVVEGMLEVHRRLERRADAELVRLAARDALAKIQSEPDVGKIERQQAELQKRLQAFEDKIADKGAGLPTEAQINDERTAIEEELSALETPEPAPAAVDDGEAADLRAPAVDAPGRLVRRVCEATSSTFENAAGALRGRTIHLLASLGMGHVRDIAFAVRAETALLDARTGQHMPFAALPPEEQDVVWLAIKIAAVERLLRRAPVPIVIDSGLDPFVDARGPLIGQLLQFLASLTQVVCISEKPILVGQRA